MTTFAQTYLEHLEVGTPRSFDNLTICPLAYRGTRGPRHQSLSEALRNKTAIVEEVDRHGSVPELRVRNAGDIAVLIMGGEELLGAKQNRVPNTSIFVEAGQEILIPVTCTEQGRWAYDSPRFKHSGHVMPSALRSRTSSSVSYSLRTGSGYASDQADVWSGIDEMAAEGRCRSRTRAMRDSYQHYFQGISEYQESLPAEPGQSGMMAFIDGRPAGCDAMSDPAIYARLHADLVASYAVAAVISARRSGGEPVPTYALADGAVADYLAAIAQCTDESFDSVGKGADYRFEGPDVVGSALVVDDAVIHAAFFPKPGNEGRSENSNEGGSSRRMRDLFGRLTRRA